MAEEYSRPSPDELLARVKAEEEQKKRGKLKIFIGYAPGVGKTYTMLEAARQLKKELDIVAAIVETHGRAETEALLKGFKTVPRKKVEYRGMTLMDMDLDAVLSRRPQLALVDELAHTNAPGLRHEKRYQDVEELLEAGIDVYTTLNIQHVESVRDMVAQITDVWMRETVPDNVIDNASEIELIDLPPDELLKRLKEGKVYIPQQIQNAVERFFQKGNLLALRELTMRTTAKHTDEQTLAYMKTHAIRGPWPTGERLLLYIGPDSLGTRLVRSARRLAFELGAEWSVLYVETPESSRLSSEQQERLVNTLRLAEKLGAKVTTIQRNSSSAAVTEFASKNNITKIVIGKPQRNHWRNLFSGSLADHIIRWSDYFDVYVVSGSGGAIKRERKMAKRETGRNWRGYLQGLGLVVLATLLGQSTHELFDPATTIMLYLLCVVITAYLWGLGPSILVSVLGVLSFDFFHVPPFLTFAIADTQYIFTFLALLLVGVVISYLASRIRWQTDAARRRERETAALYALGRDLAVLGDLDSYVQAIIKRIKETLEHDVIIFLPDVQNEGKLKTYAGGTDVSIDENESSAAVWSFQHQKAVGHGTDTLPNAKARYLPLVTARGAVGVLALRAADTASELTIEQERLLEAYADLAAVAIEGIQLADQLHNTQVLKATEKLQSALLNAISHDLRTPLVSVIGTLSSLQEEGMELDDDTKKNLIQVAREEADRLNHLITNLLDESRIEARAITLSRQPSEIQDLVGAALEQLGSRGRARSINIDMPAEMPFIPVDFGLIVQTLVNILDNAMKYSPPDSPIEVKGRQVAKEVHIEIADHGVGIPEQDLPHIFDKFYRITRHDNVAGTGLGLSISKGIVEAHSGHIEAENRPGGGTIIRMILPLVEPQPDATGKPNA